MFMSTTRLRSRSAVVLFVADVLQPVNGLAVKLLLNGDMRHGRGVRGPMPVLLPGREPDHVSGPNFLDRATLALCPAQPRRHDQGLAEWVGVPGGARAGFE